MKETIAHILRPFQYRNYRLFFLGQSIAINGTWMSLAALSWLTYRLTHDPVSLGLLMFYKQAPTFLLSPFGGVLVDHISRRRLIVIAQLIDGLTMAVLGTLTLTDRIEVWQVFAACVVMGVTKSFELPARQALVVDIVEDRDQMSNAIALNSTIFHSARLIGPMLAGTLIIPWMGEGLCFLLHALFCVIAVRCFAELRPRPMEKRENPGSVLGQMREGFAYAFGFPPVRDLLLLMVVIALFGQAYNTLLPVFAETVLGGDAGTYGLLLSATGLGAVLSSLRLASRKSVLGLGTVIYQSVLLFGISLILFAMTESVAVAVGMQFFAGMAGIRVFVGTNTIIQTLVDDELRGRVMSLMGMVFMGAMPLGSLLYGKAADPLGVQTTVMAGAVICMAGGLLFRVRLPALRKIALPVYAERGIVPPASPQVFPRP
jgi:MFS family permease